VPDPEARLDDRADVLVGKQATAGRSHAGDEHLQNLGQHNLVAGWIRRLESAVRNRVGNGVHRSGSALRIRREHLAKQHLVDGGQRHARDGSGRLDAAHHLEERREVFPRRGVRPRLLAASRLVQLTTHHLEIAQQRVLAEPVDVGGGRVVAVHRDDRPSRVGSHKRHDSDELAVDERTPVPTSQ